jgi:hypothetical protein
VAAPRPSSWPVSKLAGIERVPKPRAKLVLDEAQVPRDLLRTARSVLQRWLPNAAGEPLYVVAQPSTRPARKGEDTPELVFSAHELRATTDGQHIAQTAHVTLSARAVVKVALTH